MVPVLPACRCQTYVTGSRVFPLGEWEKCLMFVLGRLKCGLIRWTGKYDNISFRIKSPFAIIYTWEVKENGQEQSIMVG